jgi:hypothetical protein
VIAAPWSGRYGGEPDTEHVTDAHGDMVSLPSALVWARESGVAWANLVRPGISSGKADRVHAASTTPVHNPRSKFLLAEMNDLWISQKARLGAYPRDSHPST